MTPKCATWLKKSTDLGLMSPIFWGRVASFLRPASGNLLGGTPGPDLDPFGVHFGTLWVPFGFLLAPFCHPWDPFWHPSALSKPFNTATNGRRSKHGSPPKQPANQPTSQPANQPTSQPTSQPANQPTNQPANQPNKPPSHPATTNQPTFHLRGGSDFFRRKWQKIGGLPRDSGGLQKTHVFTCLFDISF